MAAFVMAFLFIPLSVFLVDTALLEASYLQLGDALQLAAEDGAQMIDENAYRQSDGQRIVLDEKLARDTASRSLQVSQLSGLESQQVTVANNVVTVSATVRVPLLVLGSATVRRSKSARFAYGR